LRKKRKFFEDLEIYLKHFDKKEIYESKLTTLKFFIELNTTKIGIYDIDDFSGYGTFESEEYFSVGEFLNGCLNGFGKYVDKGRQIIHIGFWKNGKEHKWGKKCWNLKELCDSYDGEWNEGEKEGFGIYRWGTGDSYEGQWKKSVQHGPGVFKWKNGAQYVGLFDSGKRSGPNSVFTWENGDKYEGDYKNDSMEGVGKYSHACGDVYIGGWLGNIRSGPAEYFYAYKGFFKGKFENDNRSGEGSFTWPDGEKFVGIWKNGSRFGTGKLYLKDGSVITQYWNERIKNYSIQIPEKYPNTKNSF